MKRALQFSLMLLFAVAARAVDVKFSDYPAQTSPGDTDNVIGYAGPGGTGTSRRFPLLNLKGYFAAGSQPLSTKLNSLSAASVTGLYYYNGTTFVPATVGSGLSFITGTLAATGSGTGDMLKATYDANSDNIVDHAALADAIPFSGITGKPTTRAGYGIIDAAASTHTHALSDITQSGATSGQFAQWSGTAWVPATSSITQTQEIGFGIDGGGSVITTGTRVKRVVMYPCTITGWGIVADQSGSITMDIRKGTPSGGTVTTTSITASAIPTLTSQQVVTSTTLTGWTTSVAAGDVLELVITGSVTSCTAANITLKITR